VFIDGMRMGMTPITQTLPAGRHAIRAEHEGCGVVEHVLQIEPGDTKRWVPRFRAPCQ
jgi:hypothetical protein